MSTVQESLHIGAAAALRLEPGDRLDAADFICRYAAMPELKKAELLEGVVYVPSPVSITHGEPHGLMLGWIFNYCLETPGARLGENVTVQLDDANVVQPDGMLFLDPSAGGQIAFTKEGYAAAAPELVAEISRTTVSIDLHTKLDIYRRHRVREYVVWRVLDNAVDWFVLRGAQYERLPLSPRGYYESTVFPGLWLDAVALCRLDAVAVVQALKTGLATAEHRAFVNELTSKRAAAPTGQQEIS